MGMSMWDMLASHSSWKINALCMMAWARAASWNCCSRESIKWNYEIIRWTVKLINMMTYFIKPKIFSLFFDVITPIFLMWNLPINIILIELDGAAWARATFSYFSYLLSHSQLLCWPLAKSHMFSFFLISNFTI